MRTSTGGMVLGGQSIDAGINRSVDEVRLAMW
jgi:hypothetical protein